MHLPGEGLVDGSSAFQCVDAVSGAHEARCDTAGQGFNLSLRWLVASVIVVVLAANDKDVNENNDDHDEDDSY